MACLMPEANNKVHLPFSFWAASPEDRHHCVAAVISAISGPRYHKLSQEPNP